MAPKTGSRGSPQSGEGVFEGRDLLVGRPEEAVEDRPAAEAADVSPATPTSQPAEPSPQPAAHDDAIREILSTVRATADRIDVLQDETGPALKTAEALARETAALTQAVTDARGALAKASELAARRDGAVEAVRALDGAAAALKTQGEALDQRIRATGRQSAVAAHSLEDMSQSAIALNDQLRTLGNDLLRISDRLRWRHWRFGFAVAGAAFVFFVLGLVLQQETNLVSFGDPRDAWNDHVEDHFTPTLAACASKARLNDEPVLCSMIIDPLPELTVPHYPGVILTEQPPLRRSEPSAEQ